MTKTTDWIHSARVLVELLKMTTSGRTATIERAASNARCSINLAKKTLLELGVEHEHGQVAVSTEVRLRMASAAARWVGLTQVARSLDWREFEMLAESCLIETGYQTERNIRIKDQGRAWQVDVLGLKAGMAICFDCKHWNTPSYPSKFTQAARHQTSATIGLLRNPRTTGQAPAYGLPVILTLLDPREKILYGVVLLCIEQLSDFLANLTRFSEGLPLISATDVVAENPIKGP